MNCDFLLSLRKLLGWLVAFLMALLPQHLIAQLTATDFLPIAAYAAESAAPAAAPISKVAAEAPRNEQPNATKPGATHTQARPMR
ncbi:MAG: hypothetical protein ABWX88_02665 [Pseudoxanthomonas sp.]